jgi:hypothetical protein
LERQQARDILREGIVARREYISRGAEISRNAATRQEMLTEELASLKAKTDGLAETKKAAEAEEQALRDGAAEADRGEVLRRSRILEVIGAAAESSEGVSQFAFDLLAFAKAHNAVGAFRDFLLERLPQDADDRSTLPLPSIAELEAEAAHARDEEARIAAATATAMEVDATGANPAAAINANTIDHTDIPDDPAAAAALAARIAAEAAAASDTTTTAATLPAGDAAAAAAAAAESIQAEAAGGASAALTPPSPPARQTLEEVLVGGGESSSGSDVTLPKAEAARTAYNAHISLISDKEREIKDAGGDKEATEYGVEKKYGRDGEFRVLKDKCFKKTVQGYAYEMCFFKNAKQDHVRLGSWDDTTWAANAFSDAAAGAGGSSGSGDSTVVKAKFSGGQRCWNGPARSLSVNFECHGEDTIMDVTEPSVCEYTMRFGTPAVCHPSTLEALEKELGEL